MPTKLLVEDLRTTHTFWKMRQQTQTPSGPQKLLAALLSLEEPEHPKHHQEMEARNDRLLSAHAQHLTDIVSLDPGGTTSTLQIRKTSVAHSCTATASGAKSQTYVPCLPEPKLLCHDLSEEKRGAKRRWGSSEAGDLLSPYKALGSTPTLQKRKNKWG